MTYMCPDVPSVCLKVTPMFDVETERRELKGVELEEEIFNAQQEGREPVPVVTIQKKKQKPWPYIQQRLEMRSPYWYDSRGIGETCMDNQLIATSMMNAKLVWLDYSTKLMFESDGTSTNEQNFKIKPGAKIPAGLKIATPPSPPPSIDYDIDYHKRDAGTRGGAGGAMYSAEVTSSRKLQMTAEEVRSNNSEKSMVSSASVDRFNSADRELFKQLWDGLVANQVKLPMVFRGKFEGEAPLEIYNYRFLIVPAASAKTLNPDHQFYKAAEAFDWAAKYADRVGVRMTEGIDTVLNWYDGNFADLVVMDPKEAGDMGQPPIYQILSQLTQMMQQQGEAGQERDQEIEAALKLAEENSEKIEANEDKIEASEAKALSMVEAAQASANEDDDV